MADPFVAEIRIFACKQRFCQFFESGDERIHGGPFQVGLIVNGW